MRPTDRRPLPVIRSRWTSHALPQVLRWLWTNRQQQSGCATADCLCAPSLAKVAQPHRCTATRLDGSRWVVLGGCSVGLFNDESEHDVNRLPIRNRLFFKYNRRMPSPLAAAGSSNQSAMIIIAIVCGGHESIPR